MWQFDFTEMKVLIPVDGSNSKESEGGSDSKESAYNAEDPGSIPGLGKSTGEGRATPSSILAWEIHGEGCSQWGCKEPDMTKWLIPSLSIPKYHLINILPFREIMPQQIWDLKRYEEKRIFVLKTDYSYIFWHCMQSKTHCDNIPKKILNKHDISSYWCINSYSVLPPTWIFFDGKKGC